MTRHDFVRAGALAGESGFQAARADGRGLPGLLFGVVAAVAAALSSPAVAPSSAEVVSGADADRLLCRVDNRDISKKDVVVLRSDLSPAMLVRSRLSTLSLFSGGGLTRRVLRPPGRPWLLCWFDKGSQDRPWLVVFQRRPMSVEAGAALCCTFSQESGWVACLPLYGYRTHDTSAWASVVPKEVLDRCELWARLLRRYPINVAEHYGLDFAHDVTTIRARFDYIEIQDDWKTPALPAAPVPPLLFYARQKGFPVALEKPPLDLDLSTESGPVAVVEGADRYEYRVRGLLKYVTEALEATGPPQSEVAKRALEALNSRANTQVNYAGIAPSGPCQGMGLHRICQIVASLPYLTDAYRPLAIRNVKRCIEDLHFHPNEYFTLYANGGRAYLLNKGPISIIAGHRGVMATGWNSVPYDFIEGTANNLVNIWAYYHGLGDRERALVKGRRDSLKALFAVIDAPDWARLGHRDEPLLPALSYQGVQFLPRHWYNPLPKDAYLASAVAAGTISYGRLAKGVGDEAAFRYSCYLAVKQLIGLYAREKMWAAGHDADFALWDAHWLSHGGGGSGDVYRKAIKGTPLEENWYCRRALLPEQARFYQDFLRKDIEEDVRVRLPAIHPWWPVVGSSPANPPERRQYDSLVAQYKERLAQKAPEAELAELGRKCRQLGEPPIGITGVLAYVLDAPPDELARAGADPLVACQSAGKKTWKRIISEQGRYEFEQAPEPAADDMRDLIGRSQSDRQSQDWKNREYDDPGDCLRGQKTAIAGQEADVAIAPADALHPLCLKKSHVLSVMAADSKTSRQGLPDAARLLQAGGRLYALDGSRTRVMVWREGKFAPIHWSDTPVRDFALLPEQQKLVLVPADDGGRTQVLTRWRRAGPFDNALDAGFDRELGPERGVDPEAEYVGKGGRKIRWEAADSRALVLAEPMSLAYAWAEVKSERERTVEFEIQTDYGIKVWLNGEQVWTHHAHECWSEYNRSPDKPRPDCFEANLKKGANLILLKYDRVVREYRTAPVVRIHELEASLDVVDLNSSTRQTLKVPLREGQVVRAIGDGGVAVGGKRRVSVVDLQTGQVSATTLLPTSCPVQFLEAGDRRLYAVSRAHNDYLDYYDEFFQGKEEQLDGRDILYAIDSRSGGVTRHREIFGQCQGIALGAASGELYLAVKFYHRPAVWVLDATDLAVKRRVTLNDVGPLALSADGRRLYVAGPEQDILSVVDVQGGKVEELSLGSHLGPASLACDGQGGLWVACSQSRSLLAVEEASRQVHAIAADEYLARDVARLKLPPLFQKPLELALLLDEFGPKRCFICQRDESLRGIRATYMGGTPIQAVAPGLVVFAGWKGDNTGNSVVIEHGDGWQSRYCHMQRIAPQRRGQYVEAGEMIGQLGDTGLEILGSCLYFELRKDGRPVDPAKHFVGALAGWLRATERGPYRQGFEEAAPREAFRGWHTTFPVPPWNEADRRKYHLANEHRGAVLGLSSEIAFQGRQSMWAESQAVFGQGLTYYPLVNVPPDTWYVVDYWTYWPYGWLPYTCHREAWPVTVEEGIEEEVQNHFYCTGDVHGPTGITGRIASRYNRYYSGGCIRTSGRTLVIVDKQGDWVRMRSLPFSSQRNNRITGNGSGNGGFQDPIPPSPLAIELNKKRGLHGWFRSYYDEWAVLECESIK